MGICKTCEAVLNGTAEEIGGKATSRRTKRFRHHDSAQEFWISVRDGCQICTALSQRIKKKCEEEQTDPRLYQPPQRKDKDSRPSFSTAVVKPWSNFDRQTHVNFRVDHMVGGLYRFLNSQDLDLDQVNHLHGAEAVSSYTGSEEVLHQVSKWIEACRMHELCRNTIPMDWSPTRLLDVDIPNEPLIFRLTCTAEANLSSIEYITLSHRWGSAKFLRLLSENKKALAAGSPIGSLPRTFQDAISVCRALRIRYLWIDSLCIIQDSVDDWTTESKDMCRVYEHGVCNISGTEVESAFHGLFRERNPKIIPRIQHELPNQSPFGVPAGQYDLVQEWQLGWRINAAPLNQRGWVFQERMLSPRIVHFLEDRVHWECRSMVATEGYPNSPGLAKLVVPQHQRMGSFRPRSNGSIDEPTSICSVDCQSCKEWFTLIENFTSCDFTYSDDRPWALIGLAAKIEQVSGDQYLAGLWRGHISRQLLWEVLEWPDDPELTQAQQSTRFFPSFSPLASDCHVTPIFGVPDKIAFQVLNVQGLTIAGLQKSREGLTWQSGSLEIQAKLKLVRIIQEGSDTERRYQVLRPRTRTVCSNEHSWERLQVVRVSPDSRLQGLRIPEPDSKCFLMCIENVNGTNIPARGHRWLILRLINRRERTYQRAGVLVLQPSAVEGFDAKGRKDLNLINTNHPLDSHAPGTPACDEGEHIFYLE